MPARITYLGHSGFLIEAGGHTVAIDPFLTGNPVAVHKPDEIRCDTIVVTHGHYDHLGDTVAIAKRNKATVFAAFELSQMIGKKGVEKVEGINPGGKVKAPFGYVAFTQAFHSSSFEGEYLGPPCGAIVRFDQANLTFHHLGDTALFSDLKLLGEIYKPDICAIPVGDRFTMGPELGTMAGEFVKPRYAIPVHYGTWPLLTSDISAFKPTGVEVKALKPGEVWEYPR